MEIQFIFTIMFIQTIKSHIVEKAFFGMVDILLVLEIRTAFVISLD